MDANPTKQPPLLVQDDPSEVTFDTWLDDHSSSRSTSSSTANTATTTTITIHKHYGTRPPNEDEQPQVQLLSALAAKLEQAHERIQQLERLRQADQELVRILNAKLKHLLQVQADYYLALEQDEQEFDSE